MTAAAPRYYEKPADTDFPIHPLMQRRWSPRVLSPRPVEPEKLLSLFEAARWAASSYNRQPWRFIVARREMASSFEQLLSVLKEGNQLWAQHAAVLGLAVAEVRDAEGNTNRHAHHDTGMALAHMALQAVEFDLHLHMIAGFYVDQAREVYHIPENFEPLTAFAIGYYGDPEQIPEEKRRHSAERRRRPLTETLFAGHWGESARLVREER
jgi:nitroreductase